jgi:DNA invertase Pin-like site-specific DNA recombinase
VNALEEFRSLDIDFISIREGVDTGTPYGHPVIGIFASIAEFEWELIRDRVRSGIAAARSRGRVLGRPRLEVDRARIARVRASGASVRAISEQLGISLGSLHRAPQCSKNL